MATPRNTCLILLLTLLLSGNKAICQAGMWTWMRGSNTTALNATFGTQGIESAATNPSGYYEPQEWTDTAGYFWLFGGDDNSYRAWADLWRYNPTTNNWMWVKGNATANSQGSYGTQGVPSFSNNPCSRAWGTPTWTDKNGDFWMYGGYSGAAGLSDMWRYNVASNTWTWMQGPNATITNSSPVYGARAVEAAANTPGARYECDAVWTDNNGYLWLYGGLSGNSNGLGDLWRYNTSTNQWAWMGGDTLNNGAAVYGTMGVEAATNKPGGRMVYCSWVDGSGYFWLFGGYNYGTGSNYDDMWRYNPTTGKWAWMSGAGTGAGSYGTLCSTTAGHYPGGRYENRVRWTDKCGNFWLYGGRPQGSTQLSYNDLWYFNPVTLIWTQAHGSSTTGVAPVYGTMGVAAAGNTPGGRFASVAWYSKTGDLYMYGGTVNSFNTYNDMWKFTVDPNCGNPGTVTPFNLGNDTTYCGAFSRTLIAGNSNAVWSTGATASQITVTQPGLYWASVSGCGPTVKDSIVLSAQAGSVINLGADTSYCSGFVRVLSTGDSTTHWSTGATGAQITVTTPGIYWASLNSTCGNVSDTIHLGVGNLSLQASSVNTTCGQSNGLATAIVTAGSGPYVYNWSNGSNNDTIYNLAAGNYTVTVSNGGGCSASTTVAVNSSSAANVSVTVTDPTICAGDSTQVCAPQGYTTYSWNTGAATTCIYTSLAGNYYVTVTDQSGCTATSNHAAVSVFPIPPVSISVNGDTLTAYGAVTYQWYFNGSPLPGKTDSVLIASQPGAYSVLISDSNGCLIKSNDVNITGELLLSQVTELKVYPDPASLELNITYTLKSKVAVQVYVTNVLGQRIATISNEKEASGAHTHRCNVSQLAAGVYILNIAAGEKISSVRFVKE